MATITDNLHEYICFVDQQTQKCYIEEISSGQLLFIQDEDLVQEINDLLVRTNIINMKYGVAAPDNLDKDESSI